MTGTSLRSSEVKSSPFQIRPSVAVESPVLNAKRAQEHSYALALPFAEILLVTFGARDTTPWGPHMRFSRSLAALPVRPRR
jgi:hypothetical protein